MDERDLDAARSAALAVLSALDAAVVGEAAAKRILIAGLLTGGHVLVEALPGTGKTLLCRALAGALSGAFGRIQCTPDLLPADVTGGDVLTSDGRVEFRKGPVFSNVVLVDEINRTGPKTQAALLEAMQESAVTCGGKTYPLPDPLIVVATQNPVELEGTYPLPEAQLDRFAFRVSMGGLSEEEYRKILALTSGLPSDPGFKPVLSTDELGRLKKIIEAVPVSQAVLAYAVRIVMALDPARSPNPAVRDNVRFGVSIRAAQAMVRGARVAALLDARPAAGFEDVRSLAPFALPHRVSLSFAALAAGEKQSDVVNAVLNSVPAVEDV
ncbi:MAG TPA: MoxR family ATPase [Planctomycetes bacterium]|nr:MoxR family ATPase [Planctomycetota bacterium]